MARTVSVVKNVQPQSFDIEVFGLNILTRCNLYYEGVKVAAGDLEPRTGSIGGTISTNDRGQIRFIWYLRNPVSALAGQAESEFIAALKLDATVKQLVLVDKASINTDTLPDNFRSRARCYAEATLKKSFEIKFNEVKEFNVSYSYDSSYNVGQTYTTDVEGEL
jgi:hypothetical protein